MLIDTHAYLDREPILPIGMQYLSVLTLLMYSKLSSLGQLSRGSVHSLRLHIVSAFIRHCWDSSESCR